MDHLSLVEYLIPYIIQLLSTIKESLIYIKESSQRKLVLFIKILSNFYTNKLKQAITSLQVNLAICYKSDLIRSYNIAK